MRLATAHFVCLTVRSSGKSVRGALLSHEHVEGAAGCPRIHDFETDAGAQELSSKGCSREDLVRPGSQQNELWTLRENARRIERGKVLHAANVGRRLDRRSADDNGATVYVVVDAQFAASVRADEIAGRSRVLGESHMRKILKLAPERSCPPITSDSPVTARPTGNAPSCWSGCWRGPTSPPRSPIGVPTPFASLHRR